MTDPNHDAKTRTARHASGLSARGKEAAEAYRAVLELEQATDAARVAWRAALDAMPETDQQGYHELTSRMRDELIVVRPEPPQAEAVASES
jgi:hypothetical protein